MTAAPKLIITSLGAPWIVCTEEDGEIVVSVNLVSSKKFLSLILRVAKALEIKVILFTFCVLHFWGVEVCILWILPAGVSSHYYYYYFFFLIFVFFCRYHNSKLISTFMLEIKKYTQISRTFLNLG